MAQCQPSFCELSHTHMQDNSFSYLWKEFFFYCLLWTDFVCLEMRLNWNMFSWKQIQQFRYTWPALYWSICFNTKYNQLRNIRPPQTPRLTQQSYSIVSSSVFKETELLFQKIPSLVFPTERPSTGKLLERLLRWNITLRWNVVLTAG